MAKGSPGTVGLVPAWLCGRSGSPGSGQGAGAAGGRFFPSTFAHNLSLQRAVPAAPNSRGFLAGLEREGEVSPLGLEPGAGRRAMMWVLLPMPAPCSPHQGPASPQPPHSCAGGVSWGPARSIAALVTAPPPSCATAFDLSFLRKKVPPCPGPRQEPGHGAGERADPTRSPSRLAEEVSLGKPTVPSPSPREGTAPTVGGLWGAAGVWDSREGSGVVPSPPHNCPCAGCCCSQTPQSRTGSSSRESRDSKGTRRHSDSFGFVII